jgi:hypothetical protein
MGLFAGPWFLAGVVGGLVVRRPGAALFCEVVAALVSMLPGTEWGATVLVSGILQGLGAELAFALLGYSAFGAAAAALANPKADKSLGDGFVPIILVPSASQTLITIYNVRDFLEDFVFVPSDEKVRALKGSPKPECVTVQKKHVRGGAGGPVAFEVRDKPASLKADDWARVVAVFVLGKEWQFKDWPFKDHVDIFNKGEDFLLNFVVLYCLHVCNLYTDLRASFCSTIS